MIIEAKPFDEMTLAELYAERVHWDNIIRSRIGWGSAFQLALDTKLACEAMIARREREMGDRTAGPYALRYPETNLRKFLGPFPE